MNTPPRRSEAAYGEPRAPRRRLQEGNDTGAPPPPDTMVRVSPGATRQAMKAATMPSRRDRFAAAGPSEDRAGFHPGHQSPPPNATPRQPCRPHGHGHQAAPSNGLRPRAPRSHHQGRRPGIQDLDTTSPETRHYPNQRDGWKGPTFITPGRPPVPRPNRPANTGIHRPVLQPRARDELGPPAPRGGRGQSCCTLRETSSVLLHCA